MRFLVLAFTLWGVGNWFIAAGCAATTLLDRAIEARGGSVGGMITHAETRVYTGLPGLWSYSRAFLAPDRFGWKIETTGEPHYHLFDGTTARSFVGSSLFGSDPTSESPLRSHARWIAVVNLDVLRTSGTRVTAIPAAELPDGVSEGIMVVLAEGERYRLGFDDTHLLTWVEGTLDLSPWGKGKVTARFADHRRTGALLVPFSVAYRLGGMPLADETTTRVCIDPPALNEVSFVDPARLPDCM